MTELILRTMFNPEDTDKKDVIYHFRNDELLDKINIALAIGRPLLLTGEPGVGKTSVARGVARAKGWPKPIIKTIGSRMEAADLKAEFDAIGRLSDSQAQEENIDKSRYITPGSLWMAYNPIDAKRFLDEQEQPNSEQLSISSQIEELAQSAGRVLLIDEIDKGDLDFANDLLDVFDRGSFSVPVINRQIIREADKNFLVVITSNGERDLSGAFLRRCIPHELSPPKLNDAASIGNAHLTFSKLKTSSISDKRLKDLAKLVTVPSSSSTEDNNAPINVSEYIDLIDAAIEFAPKKADWDQFIAALEGFSKSRRRAIKTAI